MPPPPIPAWLLFGPLILLAGIIAMVLGVSWVAARAGRPVPRIAVKRPAFRPTVIQGGKPDAAPSPAPHVSPAQAEMSRAKRNPG